MSATDSGARVGRLHNKRIIVTGAAGFVGRAVVSACLAEEAAVLAFDKSPAVYESPEGALQGRARLVPRLGDVTSQTDCAGMVQAAIGTLGGLDVLVNTAAWMDPTDGGPLETTQAAWDRTMEVNVKGIWLSCAACVPFLVAHRRGSIVNVASLVAIRGSYVPQIAYTASKGALIAFTRELAVHLAPHNVRVNAVCPGPLEGGLLAQRLTSDESVRERTKNIPMGRLGRATEVALACVYLASDEASFVTGIELLVDGGASAAFLRPEQS